MPRHCFGRCRRGGWPAGQACRRYPRLVACRETHLSCGGIMPHIKLSARAHAKIADLDEKLRSGLISPHRYDQICDQIMWRDQNTKTSEGRRRKLASLAESRERGQISEAEYRLRLEKLRPKRSTRRKKKPKPVSDPSLSSHGGKPALFPPGARSDRIRGRTGWLAKKSS